MSFSFLILSLGYEKFKYFTSKSRHSVSQMKLLRHVKTRLQTNTLELIETARNEYPGVITTIGSVFEAGTNRLVFLSREEKHLRQRAGWLANRVYLISHTPKLLCRETSPWSSLLVFGWPFFLPFSNSEREESLYEQCWQLLPSEEACMSQSGHRDRRRRRRPQRGDFRHDRGTSLPQQALSVSCSAGVHATRTCVSHIPHVLDEWIPSFSLGCCPHAPSKHDFRAQHPADSLRQYYSSACGSLWFVQACTQVGALCIAAVSVIFPSLYMLITYFQLSYAL